MKQSLFLSFNQTVIFISKDIFDHTVQRHHKRPLRGQIRCYCQELVPSGGPTCKSCRTFSLGRAGCSSVRRSEGQRMFPHWGGGVLLVTIREDSPVDVWVQEHGRVLRQLGQMHHLGLELRSLRLVHPHVR